MLTTYTTKKHSYTTYTTNKYSDDKGQRERKRRKIDSYHYSLRLYYRNIKNKPKACGTLKVK